MGDYFIILNLFVRKLKDTSDYKFQHFNLKSVPFYSGKYFIRKELNGMFG